MSASILNQMAPATVNSAAIGAYRTSQELSQAVVGRLLGSIEQVAEQAQAVPVRVDRVQLSAQGEQLLSAEG